MNKFFVYFAILVVIAIAGIELTKSEDIIIMPPAGTNTITKITCSGGLNCSMVWDGDLSLINITGSGGVNTTILFDDNITLNITASGGLIATYTQ